MKNCCSKKLNWKKMQIENFKSKVFILILFCTTIKKKNTKVQLGGKLCVSVLNEGAIHFEEFGVWCFYWSHGVFKINVNIVTTQMIQWQFWFMRANDAFVIIMYVAKRIPSKYFCIDLSTLIIKVTNCFSST